MKMKGYYTLSQITRTDKLLRDFFPDVIKITIKYRNVYRHFAGEEVKTGTMTLLPDFEAQILLECPNCDCTVGGIDILSAISTAVKKKQTEGTAEGIECKGHEGDSRQCCTTRYSFDFCIEYA